MSARHDAAGEPDKERFIQLWQAALVVQERLFPDPADRHPRLIGTIAMALSELLPVYARGGDEAQLRPLTDSEILEGRFERNALVRSADLERALAALRFESLDAARASLTMRQSPRADGPKQQR